ncbi:MAG: hypothetical protein WC264_01520 [Candidatus Paceibacterota bacterium]|jgi:hypothetical protein
MNEQNTLSKQTAKFITSIAQNLPEISGDVMQGWIKNPKALKKALAEALCPSAEGETFVVGDVFQNRKENPTLMFFGDNFYNLVLIPSKTKIIPISSFNKNKLKEYCLSENMNDVAIQNANSSTFFKEDQFWAILYLLIINPILGSEVLGYGLQKNEKYIFHVELSNFKAAVSIHYVNDQCCFNVFDFNMITHWYVGHYFLFLSTVS